MVLIMAFSPGAIAQKIVFFNSKPVDTLRYTNIKGSAYLYDDWQSADIVFRDGTVYNNILLNYNGYSQEFEATELNTVISLDVSKYDHIIVYTEGVDEGIKELFAKGVHYDLAFSMTNIIYDGDSLKLIRGFQVRIAESTNEIHGDNEVKKKFVQNRYYTILYKSKLQPVRLTKKKLGKILENEALINELVKDNKIDLSREQDLVKLLHMFEARLSQ